MTVNRMRKRAAKGHRLDSNLRAAAVRTRPLHMGRPSGTN